MSNYFSVELKLHSIESLLPILSKLPGFCGVFEGESREKQILAVSPSDDDLTSTGSVIIYFDRIESAERCLQFCHAKYGSDSAVLNNVPSQDWNAEWKKNFTGIDLAPYWLIVPPWLKDKSVAQAGQIKLIINPAMGFGTGTHPTTQLCLEAIGNRYDLTGKRVLDFGAGSGILSVAAALRKASVNAVEIDPQACESAEESLNLNHVRSLVALYQSLDDVSGTYDIIIANIISSVLEAFCESLMDKAHSNTNFILSGLLEDQSYDVALLYQKAFKNRFNIEREFIIDHKDQWYRIAL